ncbi:hypothetical protein [Hymenobacter cellulosivorans]|uniref:DUF4136 domain-containing protein n=1 Tax=Hymenobacter cellulosivorans TaxID=2932249 RepID=A0ABY4F8S6_9BACT|nr:hypothetical protein [Hymenobacter cellulosivorans]UOQ52918.1 hypothetical protein MUN80_24650 [Hymenobacter cellulosivorans]
MTVRTSRTVLANCGLLLLAFGCQPGTTESKRPQVYDYSVSVEETAMSQPQTILTVETGESVSNKYYWGQAHAYLFIYSQIYPVEAKSANEYPRVRMVPQDTLAVVLNRHQTDTIYYLARRVFAPPQQPALRDSLPPPRFYQMHDTDPYLVVRLRPTWYSGPTYECTGYQEESPASYALRDYLLTLRPKPLKRPQ